MKSLLFLSLRFPYPPNRGDRIRAYYTLRALAERFRITLITFAEHPEEEAVGKRHLEEFCAQVIVVPYRRGPARRRALRTLLLSRQPMQNGLWYSPEMAAAVRSVLDRQPPDGVYAHLFRAGQYVAGVPLPKVLDLSDSLTLNLSRRMEYERNPFVRALLWLERGRTRRYESRIARRFDRALVVSPVDQEALLELDPSLRIEVVTNGVDLDYFRPGSLSAKPNAEAPTFLFTGTMSYFPNQDAAYYLVEKVFPAIRREIPRAQLLLVGADPPRRLRQHNGKNGVVVTGRVPDVRPYFEVADLFLAPLRCGSGLQNKNLEAMAMGVPVITSPRGAAGMSAVSGRHLIVETHPGMILHHAMRLLGDPGAYRRMVHAGREYVETYHNWKRVGEQLRGIVAEALERRVQQRKTTEVA